MAKKSDLQEIIDEIKRLVNTEINGIFTCVFAVVEEIDHDNARVVVSHKDDKDVMTDNVPILSAYAGDGYGTIEPLKPGDEGIVMFNMDPTTDILKEEGHIDLEKQRRHSVQDAMFMPRVWLDDYEVPDHEEGERLVFHESGTFFSIKPNGNTVIQHVDGNRMRLDPDEGIIETSDSARQIGVREDGVEARVQRNDGEEILLRAQSDGLSISSPDIQSDYGSDPTSHISVDENGLTIIDGMTQIGDKDAKRIDPATENNDDNDPRTYQEINKDTVPIQDTSTITGNNPTTVTSEGDIGMRGYEIRQFIPQRREEDPDLSITDPTNPAYIDLPDEYRQNNSNLPRGLTWINTSEGAFKMAGPSGSPVVIQSGV